MRDASETAPLLLAGVAVVAFVFLFVYGFEEEAKARVGDPLIILVIPELGPDEVCRGTFTVDRAYDTMELSYQFDLAIKPRILVTDPMGNTTPAHILGRDLAIVITDPEPGNWTLEVGLEPTPGLQPQVQGGQVFLLGFPETPGGGVNPSICVPSMPDP